MVDAGSNALTFCKAFINRFHSNNGVLVAQLRELERTFKALALKHDDGREPEVLDAIRAELESGD